MEVDTRAESPPSFLLVPRRRPTSVDAAFAAAIARKVEFHQEEVAALTEQLVSALTTPATLLISRAATAEEVELFQQEEFASTQRRVDSFQRELVFQIQQLAKLAVRAGATTEVVKPLQERIAALTKQLAALPVPSPQQATPAAAATAEEAKLLQEQVVALTQQLAALAAPSPIPSDSESDDPNEPENHTYQSQQTQPDNMTGRSKFVNTITTILRKDNIDVPLSIFKVPDSLTSSKPEAYTPKLLGLGPIHYSRRELQHMQMYKVMEAKRIHNEFQSDLDFDKVIEFLDQIVGPSIRASYSIYLEMEDDVLACVMAIDGLFLFDLLCSYGISKDALPDSSPLRRLVNSARRKLPPKTTIQEAMMLENQIPIFVMKVILITECSKASDSEQQEIVSDLFPKILLGFCKYLSPLKTLENYPLYKALQHDHLLDLLYHLIILKQSPERNAEEEKEELDSLKELSERVRSRIFPKMRVGMSIPSMLMEENKELIDTGLDVIQKFAPAQFQKPIQLVKSFFDEIPSFRSIISSATKEVPAKKIFLFPTASELHKVGVGFAVVDRITNISFDSKEASFKLPVITVNANFEVIIRNLVAYEVMINSEKEPPILNWYVELMNGLIETAEDVKVLTDNNIISKPTSIDDEQVAKIFSGMNKSAELINIPNNLEDAIKNVKDHYTSKKRATEEAFMEKFRRALSKWLRVFAVLLALFLLTVQTVCSVYECPRFSFKTSNTFPAQQGLQLPSLRSHLM